MQLRRFPSLLLACAIFSSPAIAHEATDEMAHAAQHFLTALNPEQKALSMMEFTDAERKNWHYIPRARKGLPIKDMTHEQRLLAHALLATGLSSKGYGKAVGIMSLEGVLAELEKARSGGGANRDSELYFFTIFGQPGKGKPWGWRVEGHHLALNFSCPGELAPAMTPSFFGSNPAELRTGPRAGLRILADEEELGRKLVTALNEEQRKEAIVLPDAPKEIFNDPKRTEPTNPEGISAAKLTPEQSELLVKLIQEYLGRHRPDVAVEEWAKIQQAGLDKVRFTWAGGLERGQPHYYRVQNATFVLEYDNTQNEANHVHSVWRDFTHDFGEDVLKQHRDQAHRETKQ